MSTSRSLGIQLEQSFASISLVCCVSCLALILHLKLLHKNDVWNGFMMLLTSLTICQIIFEISFFIEDFRSPLKLFLYSFGYISSSLWTGIISIFLTLTVYFFIRKSFDVISYFKHCVIAVLTISSGFGIAGIVLSIKGSIDSIHQFDFIVFDFVCGIVVFNIICYAMISYKFFRMNIQETTDAYRLVYKFKLYPICQIICGLPSFVYYEKCGHDDDLGGGNSSCKSNNDQSFYFIYNILMPSSGIGFFIVFLIMNPAAVKTISNFPLSFTRVRTTTEMNKPDSSMGCGVVDKNIKPSLHPHAESTVTYFKEALYYGENDNDIELSRVSTEFSMTDSDRFSVHSSISEIPVPPSDALGRVVSTGATGTGITTSIRIVKVYTKEVDEGITQRENINPMVV